MRIHQIIIDHNSSEFIIFHMFLQKKNDTCGSYRTGAPPRGRPSRPSVHAAGPGIRPRSRARCLAEWSSLQGLWPEFYPWENGDFMLISRENHGNILWVHGGLMGKSWEKHRNMVVNYRKTIGKLWFHWFHHSKQWFNCVFVWFVAVG